MKKPSTLDEAYRLILEELFQTFLKKHKDYGKGNILSIEELGIAMRVAEKIERIKHLLIKGGDAANESLEDSWTDIAVYAVIAKLFRAGQFQSLDVPEDVLNRV